MKMRMMVIVAVLTGAWAAAFAQDDAMTPVAPYVDQLTVAIVRVSLDQFDVDAIGKRWAALAGDDKLASARQKEFITKVGEFRAAGVTTAYAVVSIADLPNNPPILVIPSAAGTELAKVRALINSVPGFGEVKVEQRGATMVAATPATWNRLKSIQPVARPDLAAAMGDGKAAAVCVAFGVGADFRRVAEETMPSLPESAGGGTMVTLSRGMQWANLQVQTTPKLNAVVHVQAADATAAGRLREQFQAFTKATAKALPNESEASAVVAAFTGFAPLGIEGDRLALRIDEAIIDRELPKFAKRVRLAAHNGHSLGNLRQIVLALHSYHDANNGRFPTDIYDKNGKPLLSWRVLVSPYIEGGAVFNEFKLDEPWDSEHNKKLIAKIPATFVAPGQNSPAGTTTYLGVSGEKGFFAPRPNGTTRTFKDIVDGTSQTIVVVEAADELAIPWTKPGHFVPDVKDPGKGLIGHYPDGFFAALCDGSALFVRKKVSSIDLYAVFTINGNETIGTFP